MKKIILFLFIFLNYPIYAKTTIKNFSITTEINESKGIQTKFKVKWHKLPIGRIGISSKVSLNYFNSDKKPSEERFFRMVDLHAYFNIPNDFIMLDFIYQTNLGYYKNDFKDNQIMFNMKAGGWNDIPLFFNGKIDFKGTEAIGYKKDFQIKTYYRATYNTWTFIPELSYGIFKDETKTGNIQNYIKCKFEVQKDILINHRKIHIFSNACLNANFYTINNINDDTAAKISFGLYF